MLGSKLLHFCKLESRVSTKYSKMVRRVKTVEVDRLSEKGNIGWPIEGVKIRVTRRDAS